MEVQEQLVGDRGRFGGAVLLRGVRGQRLHAAHGGAARTAAESVTYAGAREEAGKALIKTCPVEIPTSLQSGVSQMRSLERYPVLTLCVRQAQCRGVEAAAFPGPAGQTDGSAPARTGPALGLG